jgi:intracellular sulfur oxidation DsrE/DsrF family protein
MVTNRIKTLILTLLLGSTLCACSTAVGRSEGQAVAAMTAPGVVLLVRTPRHIAMALKTGGSLRAGPDVKVPVVEVIVCDQAVTALPSDEQLAASIAAARAHGIRTRACGLSLERFGVAAATLPADVDVVPNGIIETLRLQSVGFLSVEL